MSSTSGVPSSSRILEELTDLSTLVRSPELRTRQDVLLSDYLACQVGSRSAGFNPINPLTQEGIIGRCAWLSSSANGNDQDDIDWTVGVHPGSIVWSIALGLGLSFQEHREKFLTAALAGYRTFASIAAVFGSTHRSKWHVTATAGAFAAATTSAVMLGYSRDEHLRALHLAGANIGGSVLAPRERSGAGGFNRAAATSLGLTATLAVKTGAHHVEDLWNGPLGILELFDSAGDFTQSDLIADGISTTSLRLFPVTGFAQAAVLATSNLAKSSTGDLKRIDLGVSGGAISFLDGSRGGDWWDARSAVASAWISQDPTVISAKGNFEALRNLVHLSAIEIPIGGACVITTTSVSEEREVITSAPGRNFNDPIEGRWRNAKWQRLASEKIEVVQEVATNLVLGNNAEPIWHSVRGILND